jgi:hypothetical protein
MKIFAILIIFIFSIAATGCVSKEGNSDSGSFDPSGNLTNEIIWEGSSSNGNDSLPPDPGDAGKLSLNGIDSDEDGLRDDLQRFISLDISDEKAQSALKQVARVGQNIVVNADDVNSSITHANELNRAIECMYYSAPNDAQTMLRDMERNIFNTPARIEAYIQMQQNLIGFASPALTGTNRRESCTVNPDSF